MTRHTRTRSLGARLRIVFVCVILVVLVTVTVVFNIVVNRYVSAAATAQLAAVVAQHEQRVSVQNPAAGEIPNVSGIERSPFDTGPAVFVLAADYTVSTPQNASSSDQATAQALAHWLQTSGLTLSDVQNRRVTSSSGSFYVSCVPSETGANFVFYVDVTGIVNFAGDVNRLLIVIMLGAVVVAGVASVLITRRMTRPLVELTAFSQRIGLGDFTALAKGFPDREFSILADSMNRAARQLGAYDKDQKTFFQNVSHEFRTPLTSITCYAEGIACGIMDPKPASQTILSEAHRLGAMVEDLLSLSRIDSIARKSTSVVCDIPQILTAAAADQQSRATERGLRFVFTLDETPMVLQGNDVALQQAFSNLISNATRYATHEIALACRRQGDDVVVTVADDGPGIDRDDLPHIFERFYKGKGGSHGIGLAIVKSAVEAHDGQIEVCTGESGTTFRLTIPASRTGSLHPQPASAGMSAVQDSSPVNLSRGTIAV